MDKVYASYNLQASPKIFLKDYFQEYCKLVQSFVHYDLDKSNEERIFQLMDVELSQTRAQLITHYCSIDNLRSPMEKVNDEECRKKRRKVKVLEKISDNVQLETIKTLKTYNNTLIIKNKYQNGIPIKYEKSELSDKTIKMTVMPTHDFLVYVRLYEPFKYSLYRRDKNKQCVPFLRLKSVVSILGRQTLSELREKIICMSDLSISTEISGNPHQINMTMAKDVYKSGFFYIEDTFYNDTMEPNNIDYSSVILEWAAVRNIGPFNTATMQDTRIDSLCARFGFPWVYQHQGSCEHLVVLTDARLVNEDDDLAVSAYPKIEKIKHTNGRNCIMCGILNVRWITVEHDRIPHHTSYFCDRCFKSYNYIDGKKVGNFKAYRYPCIPELMLNVRTKKSVNKKSI